MPFPKLLLSYLLTFIVFLVVDLTWLGFIAKDLYRKYLGGFLTNQVNWTAAIIFYLLFIIGVFIFTILPAVEKKFIDIGNTARCTIRFFYLRHLRSNQSGNSQGLAAENCFH